MVHAVYLMGLGVLVDWGLWSASVQSSIFVIRIDEGRQGVLKARSSDSSRRSEKSVVATIFPKPRSSEGSKVHGSYSPSGNIPKTCRQQFRKSGTCRDGRRNRGELGSMARPAGWMQPPFLRRK